MRGGLASAGGAASGGQPGPSWAPQLVESLSSPIAVGLLLLAAAVALVVVAHVVYNRGIPFDLHWAVIVNVAIVQAMAMTARHTTRAYSWPWLQDVAVAVAIGVAVWTVGRAGARRFARPRGIVAGWALLATVWWARSIELGFAYDGRLGAPYAVLGSVAIVGAFYTDHAGDLPWREVLDDR